MNHHIWRGALILSIAAMIVKVLSAVYRLPYQNLAGDVGFYVYQQIYPFYSLAVVMGGTSFPVLISKLMAEHSADNSKGQRQVFVNASMAVGGLSFLIFIILFGGAEFIARVMADPLLAAPIRTISFIYLFVPFLAVLRGYFQGSLYNMTPTAASQVGEQALRVGLILGLSFILFYRSGTPYQFGTAAAFGSMIAPIASISILCFFFFRRKNKIKVKQTHSSKRFGHVKVDVPFIKRLLKEGIAFTLTSLTLISFQFIDSLTLVPLLKHFHWGHAKVLEGVYDRSFPLIQIGVTVAGALTASIVPAVAKIREESPGDDLIDQIKFSLRVCIIFGLAAALGLALISGETNHMLFEDTKGTLAMFYMSFNLLWIIIVVPSAGILQGGKSIWQPVAYLLAALVVKVCLNTVLVPRLGITGSAVATSLSMGLVACLNLNQVKKVYRISLFTLKDKWKLILSLLVMTCSIIIWKMVFAVLHFDEVSRMNAAVVALTSVFIGGGAFFMLIIKLNFFKDDELRHLPIVEKWLNKSKKVRVKE
ncbi:putative polysaccharide biosynthesis protein [Scopulibacillus cellulosilyticus]|uniref:Oligosaccharide flippase family protein n=1 Tax=Scopulibacillus cellulosilyticus TaxID=2665665 RepID=A0ABW2Q192_9BACL